MCVCCVVELRGWLGNSHYNASWGDSSKVLRQYCKLCSVCPEWNEKGSDSKLLRRGTSLIKFCSTILKIWLCKSFLLVFWAESKLALTFELKCSFCLSFLSCWDWMYSPLWVLIKGMIWFAFSFRRIICSIPERNRMEAWRLVKKLVIQKRVAGGFTKVVSETDGCSVYGED